MFKNTDQILAALTQTGRKLVWANSDEHALLVCGGSALNLRGLVSRPTRDVDVLGLVKGSQKRSVLNETIPEEVRTAAEKVAAELNLPKDWLNDGALEVHKMGRLPEGILERADKRIFGPCLTVYLISRKDQVALKLYAALDPKSGQRHLKDLETIAPKKAEVESAVSWLLNRKTSSEFREAIRLICQGLGFSKLDAFKEYGNLRGRERKREVQKTKTRTR